MWILCDMGKSLNLSGPQFHHVQSEEIGPYHLQGPFPVWRLVLLFHSTSVLEWDLDRHSLCNCKGELFRKMWIHRKRANLLKKAGCSQCLWCFSRTNSYVPFDLSIGNLCFENKFPPFMLLLKIRTFQIMLEHHQWQLNTLLNNKLSEK